MKTIDEMTTEELEAALAKRKENEKRMMQEKRDAYEAIRAELVQHMKTKVTDVCEQVSGLHKYCVDEMTAFRTVLEEYGQLRRKDQLSYTVQDGDFRIEVSNNKVKKFDERADAAASRLIEFLQDWISTREDGTDNPMYQLAMTLLNRNKYGDLDYKSISKLYELEDKFDSEEYTAIMQLFKESHLVEGTATNFYFYRKDGQGVWRKLEPSFNRL